VFAFLVGCTRYTKEIESYPSSCLPPSLRPTPFLVILVDAPHLEDSCNRALCRSIAKHPSNGTKNGDVGHAWIYLQGYLDGKMVMIEGGHSGETGTIQAKFFDGVMNYIECGYANPTPENLSCPRIEQNPIKYLWEMQEDGFFQSGSGGHRPSYAVKVDLSEEQFRSILKFIDPNVYQYQHYCLMDHQCTTFVVDIAALAGLHLQCNRFLRIEQTLTINREKYVLWKDPNYNVLPLASPDLLEYSMKQAVAEGKAIEALSWYNKNFPSPLSEKMERAFEDLIHFPSRLYKVWIFSSCENPAQTFTLAS
jgi:hypothetical protein